MPNFVTFIIIVMIVMTIFWNSIWVLVSLLIYIWSF